MSIIYTTRYYATIGLLLISLEFSAGDTLKGETVIKIGNHFFKESGKYQPLSKGLLFDRCSIISVNKNNEFRFIKSSINNDNYRVFKAPSDNNNIWASGIVGEVGNGLPFVWMSKRVDADFLSISYFYAWQVHLKITGIEDALSNNADGAIIIPKPSEEIESLLFLSLSIESETVSFTIVPGNYLLLLVKEELVAKIPRFTLVSQREIKVFNPDPGSLKDVFVEKKFATLKNSSYTVNDIVKSSPWLLVSNDNSDSEAMVFEMNPESVKAFNLCE
jgi:hypothetical protein